KLPTPSKKSCRRISPAAMAWTRRSSNASAVSARNLSRPPRTARDDRAMKVVKERKIVEDAWHLVNDDEAAGTHAIVSLARWNAEHAALAAGGPIGVVLRSSESPDDVAGLAEASIVAVDFPAFTDGRGYSTARMLRS